MVVVVPVCCGPGVRGRRTHRGAATDPGVRAGDPQRRFQTQEPSTHRGRARFPRRRARAIVPGRPEGAGGAPTGRAEGGVDAPGEDKQRGRAPG